MSESMKEPTMEEQLSVTMAATAKLIDRVTKLELTTLISNLLIVDLAMIAGIEKEQFDHLVDVNAKLALKMASEEVDATDAEKAAHKIVSEMLTEEALEKARRESNVH